MMSMCNKCTEGGGCSAAAEQYHKDFKDQRRVCQPPRVWTLWTTYLDNHGSSSVAQTDHLHSSMVFAERVLSVSERQSKG